MPRRSRSTRCPVLRRRTPCWSPIPARCTRQSDNESLSGFIATNAWTARREASTASCTATRPGSATEGPLSMRANMRCNAWADLLEHVSPYRGGIACDQGISGGARSFAQRKGPALILRKRSPASDRAVEVRAEPFSRAPSSLANAVSSDAVLRRSQTASATTGRGCGQTSRLASCASRAEWVPPPPAHVTWTWMPPTPRHPSEGQGMPAPAWLKLTATGLIAVLPVLVDWRKYRAKASGRNRVDVDRHEARPLHR